MALAAVVGTSLSMISFTMALILLFAGNTPNFFQSGHLVSLNITDIGYTVIARTTRSSNLSPFVLDSENATSAYGNPGNALDLPDFYRIFPLGYCTGNYYAAGTNSEGVVTKLKNSDVTSCVHKGVGWNGDVMSDIVSRIVNATAVHANGGGNVTLSDLGWPEALTDKLVSYHESFKVMVGFYIASIVFLGLAVVTGFLSILRSTDQDSSHRVSNYLNSSMWGDADLCFLIATIIATVIAVKIAKAVNHYGTTAEVTAQTGGGLIAYIWILSVLIGIGDWLWAIKRIFGRQY